MISNRLAEITPASLLIRTKNSARTLRACLDSVFKQTLLPKEILIIDSGSIDYTINIAKEYNCKIIYYPEDRPYNHSKSLNIGIRAASQDNIIILSSHCVLNDKNAIEWMVSFMNNHPNSCGLSIKHSQEIIGETNKKLTDINWKIYNKFTFRGFAMSNSASYIRRKDWEKYPFNESLPRCEDQDWALHFLHNKNRYTLFLNNISVQYNNPYGSSKKIAYEIIFVSRHYYPYWRTFNGIFGFLKKGIKHTIIKPNLQKAAIQFKTAYFLLKDRIKTIHIASGHLSKPKKDE